MLEASVTNSRGMGQRARVNAIPYNGLQGRLEADFHVQGVGTLEIDVEDGVSNDEIAGQGEGIFVDGMGSISLWYKNKTTYMFMCIQVWVYLELRSLPPQSMLSIMQPCLPITRSQWASFPVDFDTHGKGSEDPNQKQEQ